MPLGRWLWRTQMKHSMPVPSLFSFFCFFAMNLPPFHRKKRGRKEKPELDFQMCPYYHQEKEEKGTLAWSDNNNNNNQKKVLQNPSEKQMQPWCKNNSTKKEWENIEGRKRDTFKKNPKSVPLSVKQSSISSPFFWSSFRGRGNDTGKKHETFICFWEMTTKKERKKKKAIAHS